MNKIPSIHFSKKLYLIASLKNIWYLFLNFFQLEVDLEILFCFFRTFRPFIYDKIIHCIIPRALSLYKQVVTTPRARFTADATWQMLRDVSKALICYADSRVSLTIIDCRTKVWSVLRLNHRRTSCTADPEDSRTQACNRLSTSRHGRQSARYLPQVEYEGAAGIMRAEYSTPDESFFLLAIDTTRELTFEKTCTQSYLNERQLKLAGIRSWNYSVFARLFRLHRQKLTRRWATIL